MQSFNHNKCHLNPACTDDGYSVWLQGGSSFSLLVHWVSHTLKSPHGGAIGQLCLKACNQCCCFEKCAVLHTFCIYNDVTRVSLSSLRGYLQKSNPVRVYCRLEKTSGENAAGKCFEKKSGIIKSFCATYFIFLYLVLNVGNTMLSKHFIYCIYGIL